MESRAQFLGHPIHQMTVTLPIGALAFSVASDALHAWSGQRRHADAARQALDFALCSGALAAPFGLVDWLAIERGSRAKRVGAWHAIGNATMLGLFLASRRMRGPGAAPSGAKLLSAAGFMLGGVTAWLGGELVNRHGIGVHDQIGLDVPSSLSAGTSIPRLEKNIDAHV